MRVFSYITVGKILNDLWEEERSLGVSDEKLWTHDKMGKRVKKYPITRVTFNRLETRLGFPKPRRTSGQLQWRVYTPEQEEDIKQKIRQEYNIGLRNQRPFTVSN